MRAHDIWDLTTYCGDQPTWKKAVVSNKKRVFWITFNVIKGYWILKVVIYQTYYFSSSQKFFCSIFEKLFFDSDNYRNSRIWNIFSTFEFILTYVTCKQTFPHWQIIFWMCSDSANYQVSPVQPVCHLYYNTTTPVLSGWTGWSWFELAIAEKKHKFTKNLSDKEMWMLFPQVMIFITALLFWTLLLWHRPKSLK